MNARETIMEALCLQLAQARFAAPINGCDSWATLSRRLKLWSDVASADQPALFVTEHAENIALPPKACPARRHSTSICSSIFRRAATQQSIPARDLNIALDALAPAWRRRPVRTARPSAASPITAASRAAS